MMRWQKVARIAIAVGVVVFTAIVFVALRRNRPPETIATSPRTDDEALVQAIGKIDHERVENGKIVFGVKAEGHTTYADGSTKLLKARLILPDRNGRTLEITADEITTTAHPGKTGELGTAKAKGNVRLTASDGLVMTTAAAEYDQRSTMTRVPGDVQFSRGRLKGSGVGATYDQQREVLWLLKDARISIAPDAAGQGALEGSAASAGFARAEHYIRLTGGGKISGDGRTVEGDDITIQLTDDEKRMKTMQLRGNSRITGSGDPSAAPNMGARDIDLTYGEDGRALQHATLTENASVQFAGAAAAAGRRIAARNMTLALAPDGKTVTNLTANERVQFDLPAEGETSGRRISATSLVASGAAGGGLQTATFTGNVDFRETRAARRGSPASDRVARSQRLIVETKPGFGDIQQADFRGNVRFEDAETVAEAPRGVYRMVDDTLALSPSAGDPGPPPSISDSRMSVEARTLLLALQSRKLDAETNVRSSLQGTGKPNGRSQTGRGRANGDNSKLPSLLKSEEPVFVHANKLAYDGTSKAVYTGDARLFQGVTLVQGDSITLDDRTGNLTAQGKVRTIMVFADVDPKTKVRKETQTTGTADHLVYEDAKRLATYTTGPTAIANIVGPQGDVVADTIQLFLKPAANEVERAEADGKVTVKEGQRRAKGDHLTYTAANETYVMNGNPLEVDRFEPGECTRTLGVTLQFRRGDDTVLVDGIPGVTPFNTKPIPCS